MNGMTYTFDDSRAPGTARVCLIEDPVGALIGLWQKVE
jgi:predicted enzyme related to lactoylglutathione lyase